MGRYTTQFDIGEIVYIQIQKQQIEWRVLEIKITPNGNIYIMSNGEEERACYEMELTRDKDELKALL